MKKLLLIALLMVGCSGSRNLSFHKLQIHIMKTTAGQEMVDSQEEVKTYNYDS